MRNTPERRETWAEFIASLLKATGLTGPKLAERLDINPTTVWRWQSKGQKPESPDLPVAIAEMFQLDQDDVLAAAGLKPTDDGRPAEPPRPPDDEVDWILAQPVDEETKAAMLERLFLLRERDKQRRMDEIRFILEQGRRSRQRGSA